MISGEIEECSSYQADFKDLRYTPFHQVDNCCVMVC